MREPTVFIVSAPSGSGKSTLVQRLLATVSELIFSISYTTRRPRGQERNGEHYFFIGRDQFRRMIQGEELLEWAEVFGQDLYGTARRFYDEARERGYDLVLDIDVQGAAQVKQKLPWARSIFILPPSRRELEERLRRRGEDAEEVIQRRLQRAGREIGGYSQYDYVIINDDVDRAAERLCAIVLAARWEKRHPERSPAGEGGEVQGWFALAEACRTEAVEPRVAPVLRTFLEARSQ